MKKIFEDWIAHFRVEDQCDNENASTKFSNDLVIQVNSDDDNKMTNKKNNKYRFFFLLFIKSKILAFSNSLCQCFSFKRYL